MHELVPDTVYPESHVGWHVEPLARELVQLPAPPFVGAADASHVEDEVQMFPPQTTAASLVPSLEEVMPKPVLRSCPGDPVCSRIGGGPDVSDVDNRGELGAVARGGDEIPVLRSCPGGPGRRGIRGRDRNQRQKQCQKQAVSF